MRKLELARAMAAEFHRQWLDYDRIAAVGKNPTTFPEWSPAIGEAMRHETEAFLDHVVFDGERHATVLAQSELAQRSFAVFSFGKTYHATGWKLGYCVAPGALSAELRRVHQYVTFSSTSPLQQAIAEYLAAHPEHHIGLPAFYQERRDYFARLLAATRFRPRPARGTYFQLARYRAISDRSDLEFARWLTIEHGVATIPVSVFCAAAPSEQLIRFCFARERETLAAAAAKLRAL